MTKIKTALAVTLLCLSAGTLSTMAENATGKRFGQLITVYKTPTCGCCSAWVDYLKDNGFAVKTYDLNNLDAVKQQHGLADPRLASCHTAIVDGYVVEGHVPVDDIHRLLRERPAITGLTAPGMPQMSPGMMSVEPQGYDVLSFDSDGGIEVFSRY